MWWSVGYCVIFFFFFLETVCNHPRGKKWSQCVHVFLMFSEDVNSLWSYTRWQYTIACAHKLDQFFSCTLFIGCAAKYIIFKLSCEFKVWIECIIMYDPVSHVKKDNTLLLAACRKQTYSDSVVIKDDSEWTFDNDFWCSKVYRNAWFWLVSLLYHTADVLFPDSFKCKFLFIVKWNWRSSVLIVGLW